MPHPTSEKVGRGICPEQSCGEPVMYRRSKGGMLTHKCESCDSSGYAEPGGIAYAARMATIANPAGTAPPSASAADPAKPGDAVPAKTKAFSLEDM